MLDSASYCLTNEVQFILYETLVSAYAMKDYFAC